MCWYICIKVQGRSSLLWRNESYIVHWWLLKAAGWICFSSLLPKKGNDFLVSCAYLWYHQYTDAFGMEEVETSVEKEPLSVYSTWPRHKCGNLNMLWSLNISCVRGGKKHNTTKHRNEPSMVSRLYMWRRKFNMMFTLSENHISTHYLRNPAHSEAMYREKEIETVLRESKQWHSQCVWRAGLSQPSPSICATHSAR